jgi:peptidoglycan/LPS O-acetylase OafA/YrhL
MGYAYDDRWGEMSVGSFLRRRLIRLHPMVVMGVIIGLIAFGIQGFTKWDGTEVEVGPLLTCFALSLFLLPSAGAADVRGNTEMFPLNGPHWSLFFEYIGSLLYALALRRMKTRTLSIWVAVSAVALLVNGMLHGENMVAYGWSVEPLNALGGFIRLSFGYPPGLLMARIFRRRQPTPLSGPTFVCCAIAVVGLLSMPNLGAWSLYYQVACIVVFFPLIIWVGARGLVSGSVQHVASFLGRISYPLYAIHYPLIYLYIHWLSHDLHPFGTGQWNTPIAIVVIAITLATLCMLLYDEPLRQRLSRKYFSAK